MWVFHAGLDRPNLQLAAREGWGDDEKLAAILELKQRHLGLGATGSGIVSFTLIRVLERFSDLLRERGVAHRCYHGDFDRFGTESTYCRDGTDGMAPRVPGLSRISPLRRIHGCCRRGDIEPAPEKPGDPPALAERIRQHPLVGHVQHLPRRA